MAHIETNNNQPGILGLLFYKGPTGKALSSLAQTLLHGPSELSSGERELIAAHVSKLNECEFCFESHAAAANAHFGDRGERLNCMINGEAHESLSDKMNALLAIAGKVQRSGKQVTPEDIQTAKKHGASDEEIHDCILIAAAFCMYNRYVDGLGTIPAHESEYPEMGKRMAKKGYKYPPLFLRSFVLRMIEKKRAQSLKQ